MFARFTFFVRVRDAVLTPRHAFRDLTERPAPFQAAVLLLLWGMLWSLFLLTLYVDGHAPSVVLVPLAPQRYYLWQACFVTPLLLLLWGLLSLAAHRFGRYLGSTEKLSGVLGAAGFALAVPAILLWLVPEMITYAVFGFDGLKTAIRILGPLYALATLAWMTMAMRESLRLSFGRAFGAAVVALTIYVGLGAPLLR